MTTTLNPQPLNRWWRRAGKAAALAGLTGLGLIDAVFGPIFIVEPNVGLFIALGQILLAVAAAVVWLRAPRLAPRALGPAALAVAFWSLATTTGIAYLNHVGGTPTLRLRAGPPLWDLAESAALLGVVFGLARWARPVTAVLVIAVTGVAVCALPLRSGLPAYPAAIVGLAYALLATTAAAVGMYFRLAAAARERQLATVRAEQRAEFARDLHDFIAHHVTGIVVQAQGARYVADQDPGRAGDSLAQIERAGAETMAAMRRMVGVLRDQHDEPGTTVAPLAVLTDLPRLVAEFTSAGPTPAHLHLDASVDDLPVDVSSSAYRVVMEALTNVRQHAPAARRADIRITRTPEHLFVRITDDGPPRRSGLAGARAGFGLAGMRERLAALDGRLRAGPDIPTGWIVDAVIPLAGQAGR